MALKGLEKTRKGLFERIGSIFSRGLNDDFYEELEEILITADVGVETSVELTERLRKRVKEDKIKDEQKAREAIAGIAADMLRSEKPDYQYPMLLLVVGVNGAGKTTTIGRLAKRFSDDGHRVLMAAADTFRAAAAEQLETWAERSGSDFVRHAEGSDPAAVVFDGISAAKARGCDVVICDTAGRLHNKKNLMDELSKIRRVVDRDFTGKVLTLLVLDANTGLNGLEQARVFRDAAKVDGIALTKLDGTAKGGVALAVAYEHKLPIWYVGLGEGIEDLQPFDAEQFAQGIFG